MSGLGSGISGLSRREREPASNSWPSSRHTDAERAEWGTGAREIIFGLGGQRRRHERRTSAAGSHDDASTIANDALSSAKCIGVAGLVRGGTGAARLSRTRIMFIGGGYSRLTATIGEFFVEGARH